ncbi:MAG: hypothetical protein NC548_11805 [Lachnospiraceae bacterium]|nr:hypothetical protein [Lachnospiraceae bacterium]MCM1489070.1 hypothetical protein [Bacillota bacterium]
MKTTYLVYKDASASKKELIVATKKEWDSILAVNRTLPREKRRFFIESKIREGNTWDRMFIETSKEEYDKWHSQEEMQRRNLKAAERYKFLSLDYGCSFDGDVEYTETISDDSNIEEEIASDMFMADLRAALAAWKDWANELLDYYLAGKRMESTRILSQKYRVSATTIQKRKKQLDEFVKEYLKKM